MSRCFPYPPTGYTLIRPGNESLIESIKPQNEKEKAKQQKKEKRREKKEKRSEKKDKYHKLHKSYIGKCQNGEKSLVDTKAQFFLKVREAETVQLERSGLSEEHGQPVCLAIPSTSSDSTQSSLKRKSPSSPSDGSRGIGIIQIKLSSKKHKIDASTNEQQPCSNFPAQDKDDKGSGDVRDSHNTLNRAMNTDFVVESVRDQILTTSQHIEAFVPVKTKIPSVPKAVMTRMQRKELQYKNLIENWTPPQFQDICLDSPDLEWLLQSRKPESKRLRTGNDKIFCSSSFAMQPCAQYFSEVGIYALPYTVPF